MKTDLLAAGKDPMGAAILDYWQKGKAGRLRVFSSQFDEDEIPVETLFRSLEEMPELEQRALQMAQGRILDVGAGSGCHSLVLQEMGEDVLSIDISPLSVQVMTERELDARQVNLFDEHLNVTEYKEMIKKVTKEDVIKVAQKVKEDTIYFLTNNAK